MSKAFKKYLISSIITFAAAFCVAVLPMINDITLESVKEGVLLSLAFTGLRAGVKVLIESFLTWYTTK